MELDGKAAKIDTNNDPRDKTGNNPSTGTDIICKYFIEAVETSKYGFRWECPSNGDKCIYRHCLPPGFILNTERFEDDVDSRPIEEIIEEERALLKSDECTPVTLESFNAWK
jgi:hypothetical protein